MGWPEKTETLQKFYPTTDLVTGPDIIFFWVARMIMAGYEYMGELPFQNVYFTGIIRDKQGRKMSKTLGNSPDPLELIAKYGADALRFGTMRSAPLGQDVLFDEKDVELGRNFCNKLWNACRFRQMQGGEVARAKSIRTLLTSDDKWILLKLDAAIREITDALEHLQFQRSHAALYRFFWSDIAIGMSKPAKPFCTAQMHRAKGQHACGHRFRASRNTLRLFHPFLPFITEELWHGMGYHRRYAGRIRAARPSCSRTGPSRSTRISKAITAWTIVTSEWSTPNTIWSPRAAICAARQTSPRARRLSMSLSLAIS